MPCCLAVALELLVEQLPSLQSGLPGSDILCHAVLRTMACIPLAILAHPIPAPGWVRCNVALPLPVMGRLAVAWELLAEQLPSLVGRLAAAAAAAAAAELLVEQLPSVLLAVALELLAEQLLPSLLVGHPPLPMP
jgi:hypothetical protein